MITKTMPYRKPSVLLVTIFVAVGFLVTSVAQAAELRGIPTNSALLNESTDSESWWQSIEGLDLSRKPKDWRPIISAQNDTEGLKLARPFGKTGPSLQFSRSLPASVQRSLRDGGDSQIGAVGGDIDAYIFLQKRW